MFCKTVFTYNNLDTARAEAAFGGYNPFQTRGRQVIKEEVTAEESLTLCKANCTL